MHADEFHAQERPVTTEKGLFVFLTENVDIAVERHEQSEAMVGEIKKVEDELKNLLSLKDVIWDCGWGLAHCRGCLLAFKNLMVHHPELRHLFKGNACLIFIYLIMLFPSNNIGS